MVNAPEKSDTSKPRSRRESELVLNFDSDDELYKCYMPFLSNGGLFFESQVLYPLGKHVLMLVSLPGSSARSPIPGAVAWISPLEQGGKKKGVGIEFIEKEGVKLARQIETRLSGRLESSEPTYTL